MADYQFPRCQVIPLPDYQVSFHVDGSQRLRWHAGRQYPRPFFYPLLGPSGHSLTRIGHPGAPNHDHHRSIWFAHHDVVGVDFWSDRTTATIRQKQWLCYHDGPVEAVMAVLLQWCDGHDPQPLLEQELVAALRPGNDGQLEFEVQFSLRPRAETLEFGQTNFGFFAVRVAKSISAYFGGGQLVNSQGRQGESEIFANTARWVDYSGPVPGGAWEGITYIDHPANPRYPARWHVREDGWMGASPCMDESLVTKRTTPLTLRYLLHVHRGRLQPDSANAVANRFADRAGFRRLPSARKHTQYEVVRAD